MAKELVTKRITLDSELERIQKGRLEAVESIVRRYYQKAIATIATFQFVQEAQAEGLVLPPPSFWGDAEEPLYTIEDKLDFRILHRLVGELVDDGTSPADDDARKRLVWCHLRPKDEKFRHIRFRYKRKQPKGSKCKVRRVRQKAYSYTTIVCEDNA